MGAGGGEGDGTPTTKQAKAGPGGGKGEGAGGGVKVRPAAVIAFTPDGVRVLPIPSQPGVFDKNRRTCAGGGRDGGAGAQSGRAPGRLKRVTPRGRCV